MTSKTTGVSQDVQQQYKKYVIRKLVVGLGLLVLLFASAAWAMQVGAYPVGLPDMFDVALGHGEGILRHVVWNIRMPRLVAAILAGTSLGLAGAAMQTVLRNPLASPFTIGISQGAAFGGLLFWRHRSFDYSRRNAGYYEAN